MCNPQKSQKNELKTTMSWDELRAFIATVSEEVKNTSRQIDATSRQIDATTQQMKATDLKIAEINQKREEEIKRWEAAREAEKKQREAEREEDRKERKQREKEREQKRKEEIEEWNRRFEADCKATRQRLGELSTNFISQTGHIVEGLMVPSALRTLQDAGFDIRQCCRRMRGANPRKRMNMEIDLFYMNTTEAVAVEVKTYCTKNKINHFLKQMRKFKTVFPQYEGIKVYPAVAAVDFKDDYATNPANDEDYDGDEYYEGYIDGRSAEELGLTKADGIPKNETIRYAQEKGVIVLHVFDGMLTVKSFDKNGLTTF